MFLLYLRANNSSLALRSIQTAPNFILQLFLYCYLAELICDFVENINNSIYDSYWYTLTPKSREHLVLTMTYANKSIHITAAKMFRVDMETFVFTMKSVVSFTSVVSLAFHD